MLLAALLACTDLAPPREDPAHATAYQLAVTGTVAPPVAAFADTPDGVLLAHADGVTRARTEASVAIDTAGLPPGRIVFVGQIGSSELVFVHGKGLYRRSGPGWAPSDAGLDNPLLGLLGNDAHPTPLASAADGDAGGWLATVGGLFRTLDGGESWTLANTSDSGNLGLLFTDVAVDGDTVVATAQLPRSLLPAGYEDLLAGVVFRSDDGGETWFDGAPTFPSEHATAVTFDDDGALYVGTMDQGMLTVIAGGWRPIGGPSDVVDAAWGSGGLNVASGSRGLWRWDGGRWSAVASGPAAGVGADAGATWDGEVARLAPGEGLVPPDSGGGTVHIALSHHANFYHSYRGDTPDDDGFGLDIDVMRNTLDWLEEHPEVRADWDSDNAWTTDTWMPEHAPDVLAHLQERVADGRDDVRLMSWNNGAMAASRPAEFTVAAELGRLSNEAAFGRMVNGVQPQECMFGPDHIGWYTDLGINWVTLFNAANGFTAVRQDLQLDGPEAFNPILISDPLNGSVMTAVPVYHHADVLDHGGLAGWAQQLHDANVDDTLLVVHFDADGETWENFDRELAATRALPFVEWTTISTYLEDHAPLGNFALPGDVADGTGDGFQSWAEKSWNHELFAEVQRARSLSDVAGLIAPADEEVGSLRDLSLLWRLLALSTTNYGLAAPTLHPDRVASGGQQAETAVTLAGEAARLAALSIQPADDDVVILANSRETAGPALITYDRPLREPAGIGTRYSLVDDLGQPLPAALEVTATEDGTLHLTGSVVITVDATSVDTLRVVRGLPDLRGELTTLDAPTLPGLGAPFVECADGPRAGELVSATATAGILGFRASTIERWTIDVCGQQGEVVRTLSRWLDLPGVVVEVAGVLGALGASGEPEPDPDLHSVALTPFTCAGGIDTLTWRTPGGNVRQRQARTDVETWNGLAADGYVVAGCADGTEHAIAHHTRMRSSIAFAPIRNEGGEGLIAPLGTLWGDGPWHEARRTGGIGTGDLVVPIVGSQFRPAAPDWSGAQVKYRLLVHDSPNDGLLDLFAHPPELLFFE